MVNAVFTGIYRDGNEFSDLSLDARINKLRHNGIDKIYWYTWKEQHSSEIRSYRKEEIKKRGVVIREIEEPFPHVQREHGDHIRGIWGRERQIFNIKSALQDFGDDEVVLKLRWDLDFNDELLRNLQDPNYLESVSDGIIHNKIWVGFYSVQELFSPADTSFAGYKKDLNKLINFNFKIGGVSSHRYISHDGMMLMPYFIKQNEEVCELIRLPQPDPESLMFREGHVADERYLRAWAYSYYIFHKYFKTGPLGSCYFKRGDMSRWPHSIVDYERFQYNYDTICGKAPKMGLYPRYRVYDDIFVRKVINGEYHDQFGQSIYQHLADGIREWRI